MIGHAEDSEGPRHRTDATRQTAARRPSREAARRCDTPTDARTHRDIARTAQRSRDAIYSAHAVADSTTIDAPESACGA